MEVVIAPGGFNSRDLAPQFGLFSYKSSYLAFFRISIAGRELPLARKAKWLLVILLIHL